MIVMVDYGEELLEYGFIGYFLMFFKGVVYDELLRILLIMMCLLLIFREMWVEM